MNKSIFSVCFVLFSISISCVHRFSEYGQTIPDCRAVTDEFQQIRSVYERALQPINLIGKLTIYMVENTKEKTTRVLCVSYPYSSFACDIDGIAKVKWCKFDNVPVQYWEQVYSSDLVAKYR